MASLLDQFQKQVAGRTASIEDVLPVISSTGNFLKNQELQTVINSWRNILLTKKGTYMHDPEYGSEIYKYLYENADEQTAEDIKNEILVSLMKYDNRATINNIEVIFLTNRKGFAFNITATYQGETGNVNVILDENALKL